MSNVSLIQRVESAVAKAKADDVSLDELHREFELTVESLEALPWPLLKRGRDLCQRLWLETMLVEESKEFDRDDDRQKLWNDLAEWLSTVRKAGQPADAGPPRREAAR